MNNQPRFCPYCGGELAPGARKCRHCGEWVVPPAQRQAQPAPSFDSYQLQDRDPYARGPQRNNYGPEAPGFFQRFFAETFFGNYSNFTGLASRKEFWLSILAYAILSVGLAGCTLFLFAFLIPGVASVIAWIVGIVWGVATITPFVALSVRRLTDAGYSGLLTFLLIVPVVNLALIILWSMPSQEGARTPMYRFNGADTIISLLCLLVMTFGIIVSTTSLFSGWGTETVYDTDSISDTLDLFEENTDTIVKVTAPTAPAPEAVDTAADVTTPPTQTQSSSNVSAGYDPELGYDTAAYY